MMMTLTLVLAITFGIGQVITWFIKEQWRVVVAFLTASTALYFTVMLLAL